MPDELVVCDDGSTDETISILEGFARSSPFLVRIFKNEMNLGPAANFEKAVRLCEGDFIVLCDQDDVWYSDKLDRLQRQLEAESEKGGIFSDASVIDEQGSKVEESLWKTIGFTGLSSNADRDEFLTILLRKNVVTGATAMFRRDALQHVFPIPKEWLHDGWLAWLVGIERGMLALHEPLIGYRVHQRQHASIRSSSLKKRVLSSVAQKDGKTLVIQLRKFNVLASRLQQMGTPAAIAWRLKILGAVRHLSFRLRLGDFSFPGRLFRAAVRWRDYSHYTEGLQTLARDVLVPHRSALTTTSVSENGGEANVA